MDVDCGMTTQVSRFDPTDGELLKSHLADHSGDALGQLIRRHVDLVYSVARRQLRDAHLAEDVTQNVFLLLVRKAPTLGDHPNLGGWLFHAAVLESQGVLKQRSREARRLEKLASTLDKQDNAMHPADWQRVEPHLNEAMEGLSDAEREAVVLRYFQRQSYEQVAHGLGLTEAAARQRVHRGLERLRQVLEGKGVAVAAAALSTGIKLNGVQAAPPGLAQNSIAAATKLAASATVAGAVAAASIKAKLIAVVLLLASAGIVASVAVLIAHRHGRGQTVYFSPAQPGLPQAGPRGANGALPANHVRAPFEMVRAAGFDDHQGTREVGGFIGYINKGDWLRFNRVDLGPPGITGASFNATVSCPDPYAGNIIEVRQDSPTGPVLATLKVKSTGGYGNWHSQSAPLASPGGIHDIFLVFSGGGWNIDVFRIMLPVRPGLGEIAAVSFNQSNGVQTRAAVVSETTDGQWVRYDGLDLSPGVDALALVYACDNASAGGTIAVHLDGLEGPVIGEFQVQGTGSFSHFVARTLPIAPTSGKHNVVLLFSGPKKGIANLRSIRFYHRTRTAVTVPAARGH